MKVSSNSRISAISEDVPEFAVCQRGKRKACHDDGRLDKDDDLTQFFTLAFMLESYEDQHYNAVFSCLHMLKFSNLFFPRHSQISLPLMLVTLHRPTTLAGENATSQSAFVKQMINIFQL